jgi:3-isopropylmalate/(R)-2-methylmalate dehydratase large subunit
MGYTLVEKILARSISDFSVKAGQIVNVPVDRLLLNDFVGPITFGQFESLNVKSVKQPERIIFGIDHRIPPADVRFAANLKLCREKCKEYNIENFAEIGRHGIGHQLMVEKFTLPGEVALGTDSHSTMYGGLGALACGITASDAAIIMATGKIWLQIPQTIRVNIRGKLGLGVTAKDVALKIMTLAPIHTFVYRAIEFCGECIDDMSVSGRLVIANMVAEVDAKCGIIAADDKTASFVGLASSEIRMDRPDQDAEYTEIYDIDASKIGPLVACPHQVNNVKPITEIEGTPIHQAFLGSCTNGRIEDLEQALQILRGKHVHRDVRLIVVPASQSIMIEATRLGIIEELLVSGAAVMTPNCSACAGGGPGLIAAGERCVSTTNRNFKGRMGSLDSEVYLSSAYVVAAAAVTGKLTDPRVFL